jgi:hypothetical protein
MAGAMATGLGGSQRVSKMRRLTDKFHCSTKQTIRGIESDAIGPSSPRARGSRARRIASSTHASETRGLRPPPSLHDSQCRLTFVEESSRLRRLSRDWRYLEGRWTWVVVVVLRLVWAPSSRGTWAQCPSARLASWMPSPRLHPSSLAAGKDPCREEVWAPTAGRAALDTMSTPA